MIEINTWHHQFPAVTRHIMVGLWQCLFDILFGPMSIKFSLDIKEL